MKKTLLNSMPIKLPGELLRFTEGADIYDSSSSPEAKVYFLDKDGGYYLKTAKRGELLKEAEMTSYFHARGLGAELISYISEDADFMLTARLPGEDCTHYSIIENPKRLCESMANILRGLHESEHNSCPVKNRMSDYSKLAEANYEKGIHNISLFSEIFNFSSPDEAYKIFLEGRCAFKNDVLIHGDFCLPNIILNGWKLSGLIDLGGGGLGDRHVDVFWGLWTLVFNLKTTEYCSRFLDAYGRDKIDISILKTVAAAEVFG